ncbi:PREDICTED: uncharacterized protein LOC109216174 [Nicotiana attenuata]|uniref:uncharacterized protein LOC109216174 n=1 Tax=Nicotiana attenuata TaxID=49451 RepID=UPI0009048CDC|nr:PREDICTED: uncharacterized protein LOC109216174 [Nicotiana attenuata]
MISSDDNDTLTRDPSMAELKEIVPICLSNFINKIISNVICSRLGPILPKIISANQSGFVKSRNIFENIMLAQEIVHGIKKPTVGSNVVIKLDMAKAYNRVSWSFTCIILMRMGSSEMIIDMIWRTMSNNWYQSLLMALDVDSFSLQEALNRGFYMEKRGPQINHLSFVDDIIIFTSGRRTSLRKIMWILSNYEKTSGQLINKHKSQFMTASYALPSAIRRIQEVTGFSRRDSPLTYLGCPLYTGRSRIMHFNGLISKVLGRIKGWHVSPPKTVMKQIERLTASFFWGIDKDKTSITGHHGLSYPSLSMKVVWVSEPFMIPVTKVVVEFQNSKLSLEFILEGKSTVKDQIPYLRNRTQANHNHGKD